MYDIFRRLRQNTVEFDDQFEAHVENISYQGELIIVPLSNANGKILNMTIDGSDTIARLRIQEPDNTRFELPTGYSLQAEPKTIKYVYLKLDCREN